MDPDALFVKRLKDEAGPADQPPAPAPHRVATALCRSEAAQRVTLGAYWLGASHMWEWSGGPLSSAVLSVGLAGAGLALATGRAPRTTAMGAWAIAGWLCAREWITPGVGAQWFATLATAIHVGLHSSPAGGWLRNVQRIERRRRAALLGVGLLSGGAGTLARAGDVYELEGIARRELRAVGAEPGRLAAMLRPSIRALTRAAIRVPGCAPSLRWLAERLAQRLELVER